MTCYIQNMHDADRCEIQIMNDGYRRVKWYIQMAVIFINAWYIICNLWMTSYEWYLTIYSMLYTWNVNREKKLENKNAPFCPTQEKPKGERFLMVKPSLDGQLGPINCV